MNGKLKEILRLAGGEWVVSFTPHTDPRKLFDSLKDGPVEVDIKKPSRQRSKTANDFMWALCTDIGKAMKPPLPKEYVYRKAIREVGVYQPLPIKEIAVETFCRRGGEKGVGWFADVMDDIVIEGHKGYKLIHAYYGTSTYTSQELSILLDYLKQDAENMGLVIPLSAEEEKRLLARWGKASCSKTSDALSAAG